MLNAAAMQALITGLSSGGPAKMLPDCEQHATYKAGSGSFGWRNSFLHERRVVVVAVIGETEKPFIHHSPAILDQLLHREFGSELGGHVPALRNSLEEALDGSDRK